jgi:hypothetical protein
MADPVSMTAFISAMAPSTAAAAGSTAAAATAAAMAAPTAASLLAQGGIAAGSPLTAAMANGMQAGQLLGMAGNVAPGAAQTIISPSITETFPALNYSNAGFGNANLPALSGTPGYSGFEPLTYGGSPPASLASGPGFVGPQTQIQGLMGMMNNNPALTNVAMRAGGAMMQPPPPPKVLQAPPIQSGQFAPVDFMSLLSQKPPQMQRRTSLLG